MGQSRNSYKIDFLKPGIGLLTRWTDNFANIGDTFTKNGYKLSLGRWFPAAWRGNNPYLTPKSSFIILQFIQNEEESFVDRSYEIEFSISKASPQIGENIPPRDYMMKMKFKFSWVEGGFITVKYSRS